MNILELPVLDRAFYLRPTLEIAPDLLGKILVSTEGPGLVAGRIVEVEAYHQDGDRAAHSYRGRTKRNEIMFREGGILYVYFTYGMHFCMNVVTEKEGVGAAVLIRAVEPLAGLDVIRKRRPAARRDEDLTNGPAKVCQAYAVNRRHNGLCLLEGPITIRRDDGDEKGKIVASPRIGIRDSVELPWRFFLAGNPFVGKAKPAARGRSG
ncbi:MAG: DNA-3-methyladenine glycosylase [Chlorobi bacterium]|nr:DNA-3-methyladenine glycosylase [Chlorobiota bacterium]